MANTIVLYKPACGTEIVYLDIDEFDENLGGAIISFLTPRERITTNLPFLLVQKR